MTNESQVATTNDESTAAAFGARLKATRKQQGLEIKDISAQLRLNEKVIESLEEGVYLDTIPTTFLRGYLRVYGKFLQIPADEVKAAIEPIKAPPLPLAFPKAESSTAFTSENYYMRFFTYLIVFTMFGLVGTWWHNHTSTTESTQLLSAQNETSIPIAQSASTAIQNVLGGNQPASAEKAPTHALPLAAQTANTAAPLSQTNKADASMPPQASIALAAPKSVKHVDDGLYGEDAEDEANTNE